MGNFRFREEFGRVRGFDISEINKIPSFAVMSSIVNRLDLYIGVASTFEEMNFANEFIEYVPRDVLIIEEYDELESGSTIRTAVDVPLVPAPAAECDSQQVHPPLVTTPKTSRLPPIGNFRIPKSIPKKDIERSGIDVDLLNKSNGIGRPRKSDHIVKGPSRLREVTNAADLETPRQLASSQIGYDQNSPPARPFTPSPRSVQTLARSPFKEFSLSMPPPKHSASFRDDLPAQPAPASPPKGSSRSDATDKTVKSAASQHATNCRPVDVFQSATSASSSPSIVSLPNLESGHNARSQETLKATPGVQIPPGVQPAHDRNDRSDGANDWDRTGESRLKTLNPITLSNRSDSINDLNGAKPPRLQKLIPVAVPNQPDPAGTSTSSATADNPGEPKTPTTSFDFITYSPNKSRSSSPTKSTQGSTRKPGQVSPIKPRQPSANSSGMVNDSAIQAPTKNFDSRPSASGIVNSLEPQTPSKSLDANPKTPNKPRKTSISKAETMKAAHQAKAVDKSEKVSANPSTKSAARHARTDSQSSVESVDLLRACNSNEVSDSGVPHLQPPDPSKSTVEVQIPARKRAASELLAGSFERLGSPAKKLKSSEASSSCAAALGVSKTKAGAGKKGPNKVMKKAEPQISEDDEYPSASTSAPAPMSDPPARGPKKKAPSGNKSQPRAAPPKPAPPSKPAAKAAIKATKTTTAKAKPKGNKD